MAERLARVIGPGVGRDDPTIEIARACIAEIEAAGMVIVPREPTEAMVARCAVVPIGIGDIDIGYPAARDAWKAMITAALEPAPARQGLPTKRDSA